MATIDTKICEYITPESETNAAAEEWEYYLVWQGVDGGVYNWLFEDFTHTQDVQSDIINSKSSNITKVFRAVNNSVLVIAEDLSENEFDTLRQILRAKLIRRYYKDGTYNNVQIITSQTEKPKSKFRYSLQLEIIEIESPIMS